MRSLSSLAGSLRKRRLSLRLLVYVGSCTLLFAVLAVSLQLYIEYRRDSAGMEARLQFIASSYAPAITASAYQLDEEQIRLQLKGILQLQDVVYAEMKEDLNTRAFAVSEGDPLKEVLVSREYPLVYSANRQIPVGTLLVRIGKDGIQARMKERVGVVALGNILLIIPLACAILLIFQVALHRHLVRMAQYTQALGMDTLDRELELQRGALGDDRVDELDQLAFAINEMRIRIRDDVQNRQKTERELQFQKVLLECVLQARIDGIIIFGADQNCLFANQHFFSLWPLQADQNNHTTTYGLFGYIEGQLQQPQELRVALASLYNSDGHEVLEGELTLLTGQIYEYSSVPVQNETGFQYGRLWSFRDATRRKVLEDQLHQAQKLETIGGLAGGIAHDFNNLLSPIIGYAELGQTQVPPDDKLYLGFTNILKAAHRASELTQQILAFSRKQMLEFKILDLNSIITEIASIVERLIGEMIAVRIVLKPGPFLIRADKNQIEQVVLNMAINARDAMPTGGTLTIETAEVYLDQDYVSQHVEVQPGWYIMLAITDTGVGIDAAIRDRIFDPFFTTKERGKGTGLGLATTFGIVKQHLGHIRVYSEIGHGTAFKIYLPKVDAELPADEPAFVAEVAAGLHQGVERVMVVEDDLMVRELACETLLAGGYEVIKAESPMQAVDFIAQGATVDLLLTDVVMPKMNGRELYQQLSLLLPGLKVLYMSGYTDNVIADQGVLHAGVSFIQKPFSVRALLEKVRQVLG